MLAKTQTLANIEVATSLIPPQNNASLLNQESSLLTKNIHLEAKDSALFLNQHISAFIIFENTNGMYLSTAL